MQLQLKFEPFGGAKIDPDSVKMIYFRTPNVDLTSRVKSFVGPSGIDMPEVELPAGEHMVRVDIKDTDGRVGTTSFILKVVALSAACPYCARENPPEALVCGYCSREIAVPQSLLAERNELSHQRDTLRLELDRAKSELETLMRRRKNRSA